MTTHSLEQALHLYGDELYQTALLLTLDPDRAGQALLRAVRALVVVPPPAYDIQTLTSALVAALPAKQPQSARGLWNDRSPHAPVLAAIMRLPREQWLVLDLVLRRDHDPEQLGSLFDGDPAHTRDSLRDALLALAPTVDLTLTPALLLGDDLTPAECRATRMLLVLAHADAVEPARGHLALCSACRAADQGWERVRIAAESALRAILRDVTLPPPLAERIEAVFQPQPRRTLASRISRPRLVQIGLPLVVLLIVGLLVLPRNAPPAPSVATGAAGQQQSHTLVQQALRSLYAPSAGAGVWHGQYEIRWNFSSAIYATLVGDIWSTPQPQQTRMQLVHIVGGAPYEFALANSQYFWYANTEVYGTTLLGPLFSGYPNQVRLTASSAQQHDLIQTRLDSGAWGVAANYLRQAAATRELRTWGRQRLVDGSEATVIGFVGTSPIGVVADAPDAPTTPLTILLTIGADGRLHEVREVSGPVGGEQTGQTIWRLREDAHVTDPTITATLFNVDRAYNGLGTFLAIDDPRGSADPALPNLSASMIRSPADNINAHNGSSYLPTKLPAGIEHAVTVAPNAFAGIMTVYSGLGRVLMVSTAAGQIVDALYPELDQNHRERISHADHQIQLIPGSGQRYGMQVSQADNTTTQVFSIGVSRAELLDLAASLKQFSIEDFKRDMHLFRTPQPHDPAAFAALLAALDTQPLANGQARHVTETTFTRQGPLVDPLPDPYHQPYYAERTPTMTSDLWTRRLGSGQLESATTERDATGALVDQSVTTTNGYQSFNAAANSIYSATVNLDFIQEPIYEPTWTVVNLLGCGGTTLETRADGTRVVTQRDADWYNGSCNRPFYANDLYAQMVASNPTPDRPPPHRSADDYQMLRDPDSGPYLLDVADQPLTHRVFIDQDGQAYRYEVRAGDQADGVLLEAVEHQRDGRLDAARVPVAIFDGPLPSALITMNQNAATTPDQLRLGATTEISLTSVITGLATPLWYLPPDAQTQLQHVQAVLHPELADQSAANIFEEAMKHGFATRLIYNAPNGDTNGVPQALYLGEWAHFGAFLRTQRAWKSSQALAVQFDGRSVNGWQVTTRENKTWTLLDIDGTLIALDTSSAQRQARLALLRRYAP